MKNLLAAILMLTFGFSAFAAPLPADTPKEEKKEAVEEQARNLNKEEHTKEESNK